jgi:hypothetical protein
LEEINSFLLLQPNEVCVRKGKRGKRKKGKKGRMEKGKILKMLCSESQQSLSFHFSHFPFFLLTQTNTFPLNLIFFI